MSGIKYMSNTSNSLVVQGKPVTVAALPSARHYMASKHGITLPVVAKGQKGPSMKEVKEQILATAKTPEEKTALELSIKATNKEYDTNRRQFYVDCALVNGQLAADPTLRKSLRLNISKKSGEVIGATCSYRKEKSASLSQAAQIAQLQAVVTALTAKLALNAPAA